MIDARDVAVAQARLAGVVFRTPAVPARWLSDIVGGPAYLKCENLQRTGSFKIRGAYNRIASLSPAERARGVVAASAGNHAQGVALAAQLLGVKSTVFMPEGATLPKIQATVAYGATVEFSGSTIDEALTAARAFGERTGAVLIHPFDHPDIVAGQATVGQEIAEQHPEVRTVVVCTGGGGLLAGVCLVLSLVLLAVLAIEIDFSAAVTTFTATGPVKVIRGVGALGFFGALLTTTFLSALSGVGIGLLLSSASKTSDRAMSLVPLVLVPQLLLALALVPLPAGMAPLSYLTSARWAMEALGAIAQLPPPRDFSGCWCGGTASAERMRSAGGAVAVNRARARSTLVRSSPMKSVRRRLERRR